MTIEQPGASPGQHEPGSHVSAATRDILVRDPLRWALFLLGIILTGASVGLVVRSDMGVSVLVSVPYMLNLLMPAISLGTWNYVVQGSLMLLLVIILRSVKLQWFFSFGVSVFFGLTIDVSTFLCSFLPTGNLALRLVYFCIGFLFLTLGVPVTIKSGFPALPFDVFVKESASFRRKNFHQVKTAFDLLFLAISVALMVLVVRRLTGIGVGTVFSALTNGTAMHFFMRCLDKALPARFKTQ